MNARTFIRPSPDEIAFGVMGRVAAPKPGRDAAPEPEPEAGAPGRARAALEAELRRHLGERPLYVSFSGGRDSSAVLALATALARQGGLPDPVPVIRRYPGDHDSDETAWQELVLEHLGIRHPIVIDVTERATYLDATVTRKLRERGLVWPPALQLDDPMLPIVAHGTLLTGEGGDEVLGTRRVTPLTLLLRLHRRPSAALLRWAANALGRPRAGALRAGLAVNMGWLTEAGRRELAARVRRDDDRPLHWGDETERMLERRLPAVLAHNYQCAADEYDVRIAHPLLAPGFVRVLAAEGGRWGFAGRTALMRYLFSDLLPDALLARSTKAHFGAVRWGEPERAFAREWDGTGLPAWIDPGAIRAEWLSDRPAGASALALHAAWLHQRGLPQTGDQAPAAVASPAPAAQGAV